MKQIIRKTDQLGRILIPRELRAVYGIDCEFTSVELIPTDEGILVRKVMPRITE